MDIVRESIILNEEVVGYYIPKTENYGNTNSEPVKIVKNPKGFVGMVRGVRGISFGDDMYVGVISEGLVNYTHYGMIKWLCDKGILPKDFNTYVNYHKQDSNGIICWERVNEDNTFFLSEGYFSDYLEDNGGESYISSLVTDELKENIGKIFLALFF